MENTYRNGCPRVGYCIECKRAVALTHNGWLVPHNRGKRACYSDWIPLEQVKPEPQKEK